MLSKSAKKFVIESIIDICGIIGNCEADFLGQYTLDFINNDKLLDTNIDEINACLKYDCVGTNLFRLYKDNISKVKKIEKVKSLQRRLWLYHVIVVNYRHLSIMDLNERVDNKYQQELQYNPKLPRKFFELYDRLEYIENDDMLVEVGIILDRIGVLFHNAYSELYTISEQLNCMYLAEIYGENDATIVMKPSFAKNKKACCKDEETINGCDNNKEIEYSKYEQQDKKIKELSEKTKKFNDMILICNKQEEIIKKQKVQIDKLDNLTQKNKEIIEEYKNMIRLLTKSNDNLQVEVNHSKKDSIRDILIALTDKNFESPLNELYVLLQNENLNENIKGILTNLFVALEEIGIRVKDGKFGKNFVINEQDHGKYMKLCPDIKIGDKVTVVYPGYWYKNENMIKPVIKKDEVKDDE